MILYGIPNCDSVKKARRYLNDLNVAYEFFDVKKQTVTPALIQQWVAFVECEVLFNKRSKTFKELTPEDKSNITEDSAIALMCKYPTLIKRPVLQLSDNLIVGFQLDIYTRLFHE